MPLTDEKRRFWTPEFVLVWTMLLVLLVLVVLVLFIPPGSRSALEVTFQSERAPVGPPMGPYLRGCCTFVLSAIKVAHTDRPAPDRDASWSLFPLDKYEEGLK